MGSSQSRWYTPNKQLKTGTTLVELTIPHVRDAHNVIGLQPEGYTPVILVPQGQRERCCCVPCCWVQIPNGFTTIVTRCGADADGTEKDGTWAAGGHCLMPWHRIARMVSKQWIIFDVPVKECRTSDFIWVNIDVLVVFEISDAKKFIYRLGPEKLDDLLRAEQEEFLRGLVSKTEVKDIYDLQDADTDKWLAAMNKDFERFGVTVHNVTVTNVKIPNTMAQDFEEKTLYESRTVESQMKQESDRLNLNNEEALEKLREECDNARMAAEMEHVTKCSVISKEVKEVTAKSEAALQAMGTQRDADVMDLLVNADGELARIQAETASTSKKTAAQIEVEQGTLDAEAAAYELTKKALSRMEASAKVTEGKIATSLAEGAASEAFAAKRQQDEEMMRLEILASLAKNPHIHIITSVENNTGLAPGNSLVSQIAQQGMEALRMKLAEATATAASKLDMGKVVSGGLVRPVPQMTMAKVSPR